MKTLLLAGATVALLTAVNFAPAMAQGPKLSIGNTRAGISQPVDNTQLIYPIPRTMYEEVIVKYRIGYDHKAVYAKSYRQPDVVYYPIEVWPAESAISDRRGAASVRRLCGTKQSRSR